MARFAGKVAFVTGAASGIGKVTAQLFAEAGAKVVVADINEADGAAVAAGIGENATFVALDVTQEASWRDAFGQAEATFGGVNHLINAAGISPGDTIENASYEHWRKINAICLDGVFLGCKHGVPLIDRSGGGSIVNISSVAGLLGVPHLSSYSAAKAGVRNLTKSVAMHCTKQGYAIRCNSIHPGSVETPILAQVHDGPMDERHVQARAKAIPMRRIGQPEEIAKPILFLASDDASFITGIELVVDGGYTAR